MSHELRDRAYGLLSTLCANAGLAPDALRVTSHTLVNLADDTDGDALAALADALPWLSALLQLEGGVRTADVADQLGAGLNALDRVTLERQLEMVRTARLTGPVDLGPRWQSALEELALLDRRLVALTMLSDRVVRNEIINDVRLLRAGAELVENGATTPAARRLAPLYPRRDGDTLRRSRALCILEGLETRWDGGPLLGALGGLSDRALRFEISSTDHLNQNGYLVAVRAALAFSPGTQGELEAFALDEFLATFEALREDPALASLALALSGVRFKTLEYLRGAAPLATLTPWVSFLRGPCAELAEARGLTLREATSFAHFCLHLMNFCDLAAYEVDAATDDVRRSLMDVEDELKEFALMGQRQGLSDVQANLARYDSVRWKSESAALRVADRFARLRGAWRKGLEPAPLGAPPRARESMTLPIEARMNEIEGRAAGALPHLVQLLDPARILGSTSLESMELDTVVSLLIVGLVAARDLPGIDASRPFTLDLSAFDAWLSGDTRRAQIVARLLDTVDVEGLLLGESEGPRGGIIVEVDNDRVSLRVETSDEMDALLTILASGGLDPFVADALTSRLERMLQGDDASSPWDDAAGDELADPL